MITKFNRNNTNFQIAYFIAGSCHTADAAHVALVSQRQERDMALQNVKVVELRQQAARLRAEQKIASKDPALELEGRADLLELDIAIAQQHDLIKAAEDELAFIDLCIEKIQPFRKYANLTDAETAEACQMEEWALELAYRAENYMLTQGTIPHDQFATMRQHPNFKNQLLPHIENLQKQLATPTGYNNILENKSKKFDLPLLLGLTPSVSESNVQ